MKQYLLAAAITFGALAAHAADVNVGIFQPAPSRVVIDRDRHHNYDWSYWQNDDRRGNYHEGHNGKPGHWDNGKHKGQNKHDDARWDNDRWDHGHRD